MATANWERFCGLVGRGLRDKPLEWRLESCRGLRGLSELMDDRHSLTIYGPFGTNEKHLHLVAGILASRGCAVDDGVCDLEDLKAKAEAGRIRDEGLRWVRCGKPFQPDVIVVGKRTNSGIFPGMPLTPDWRRFYRASERAFLYPDTMAVVPKDMYRESGQDKATGLLSCLELGRIEPLGGVLAHGFWAEKRLREIGVAHTRLKVDDEDYMVGQILDARRDLPPQF